MSDEKEDAKETSLADEIGAAFNEAEPVDDEAKAEDVPNDEPAQEEAAPEETADEEIPAEEAHDEEIPAPEHWPQTDKDLFNTQPPEVRKWLIDKSVSLESGYNEKFQEIAGLRKAIEPYAAYLQQVGTTPEIAFGLMMDAERLLRTGTPQQKRDAYDKIARDYGIEPEQAATEDFSDPAVTALREELTTLRGQIQSQVQTQQQGQQDAALAEIQAFSEEKTEAGDPARPHLEAVMGDMVALANVELANGRKPNLDNLYDRAVWSNPDARAKMLDAKTKADSTARAEAARVKAEKAKDAGSSVSGAPVGQESAKPATLEQTLNEAYEQAS